MGKEDTANWQGQNHPDIDVDVATSGGTYFDDYDDDYDDVTDNSSGGGYDGPTYFDDDDAGEEDSLQGLEDALAEEFAAEQGGTGRLNYYNDNGYDPEASALTDVDYKPDDAVSTAINNNFTGADAFIPFQDDIKNKNDDDDEEDGYAEEDDEEAVDDEDDDFDGDDGDFDGDDEDEDDDDDDDEDDEDEAEDGEDEADNDEKKKPNAGQNNAIAKQPVNGNSQNQTKDKRIPWKSGDKIDLKLMTLVWDKLHQVKEVEGLINSANEAVSGALKSIPNSMMVGYIQSYDWIRQLGGYQSDLIGTILDLAAKFGMRTTYTVASVVVTIFAGTVADPVMFATLPPTVEMLLAMPPIQALLKQIFEKAVPILEDMEAKK